MTEGTIVESLVKRGRVYISLSDLLLMVQKEARMDGNPDVKEFIDDLVDSFGDYESDVLKQSGKHRR